MRAAIYARTSTRDQHADVQTEKLLDYVENRDLALMAQHIDDGISGSQSRRPALDALMAEARRREFDVVIVVKLDRLARSVRHLCNLTAELEALGIDLVVIDQGIDTSTPSGRLLFHTLAAVAEFEGDLIRERTRAGLEAARRRGRKLGRPRTLDRQDRERLQRLRSSGASVRSIAATLGCSATTIQREVTALGR